MCIIKQALKVMETEFKEAGEQFSQSEKVKQFCRLQLGQEKEEVFAIIFLDSKNRLLSFEKMFRGSIAESNIYIRPIVRRIFELNAAKIILTHNHPSGDVTPSYADEEITNRFKKFFDELDCPVLDHIIVSATNEMSFRERGLL